MLGWTEWPARALRSAFEELARKAVDLDDGEVGGLALLSLVHGYEQRWDLAEAEIDRAVELNPGDAEVRAQRGGVYLDRGRLEEAIRELEMVRSPSTRSASPGWSHSARPTTSRAAPRTRWTSWSGTSSGGRTGWMERAVLAAAYAELGALGAGAGGRGAGAEAEPVLRRRWPHPRSTSTRTRGSASSPAFVGRGCRDRAAIQSRSASGDQAQLGQPTMDVSGSRSIPEPKIGKWLNRDTFECCTTLLAQHYLHNITCTQLLRGTCNTIDRLATCSST